MTSLKMPIRQHCPVLFYFIFYELHMEEPILWHKPKQMRCVLLLLILMMVDIVTLRVINCGHVLSFSFLCGGELSTEPSQFKELDEFLKTC